MFSSIKAMDKQLFKHVGNVVYLNQQWPNSLCSLSQKGSYCVSSTCLLPEPCAVPAGEMTAASLLQLHGEACQNLCLHGCSCCSPAHDYTSTHLSSKPIQHWQYAWFIADGRHSSSSLTAVSLKSRESKGQQACTAALLHTDLIWLLASRRNETEPAALLKVICITCNTR
jgi:hypothetical protein